MCIGARKIIRLVLHLVKPAVHLIGFTQAFVHIVNEDLCPFAVAPDAKGRRAMNAFTGAFNNMRYFMRSDIEVATGAACPRSRSYIDHIAVIMTGIEISRRMTAAVFIGMKDGEQMRIAAKAAIHAFRVTPYITHKA